MCFLHFNINFTIDVSISKKSFGILVGILVNLLISLGRIDILKILNFSVYDCAVYLPLFIYFDLCNFQHRSLPHILLNLFLSISCLSL